MSRRAEGLATGPRGWAEAPAPPQRQVTLPPEGQDTALAATGTVGLSRYFPGLRRNPAEPPKVAGTARPSRFSFARRPRANQIYTTDARSGLKAGMAEAEALPVALQVPAGPATDDAVTPTRAESPVPGPGIAAPEAKPEGPEATGPAEGSPLFPPTGGVAAPAVAVEANPEAPAAGPEAQAVARKMPELPAIDPLTPPRPAPDEPKPEVARASAAAEDPLPAAVEPEPRPAAKPDRPAADPRERPRMAPAPSDPGEPGPGAKSDDQAVQAGPTSAPSPGLPEPTTRVSFLQRMASTVRVAKHDHAPAVLASPQALPTPQARPTPQAKPTPQVLPTSQAKPSAQGAIAGESCEASHQAKRCQKCCLKQLVRKVFQPSARPRSVATR